MGVRACGVVGSAAVLPSSTAKVRVQVSHPINPRAKAIYGYEGAQYPTDPAAQAKVVDLVAMTYERLLCDCAAEYPSITLQRPGDPPLTSAQVQANYTAGAACAYEKFFSKPYWVPQLVSDVDVCGRVLGAGWRLPAEDDVAAMTSADFQLLAQTMTATSDPFAAFYFPLRVYARGRDGTLREANLGPGVTARVVPLTSPACGGCPVTGDMMRNHLEGGISIRCLRRTAL